MRRAVISAMIVVLVLSVASSASGASPPTIVKFPKGTIDLGNLNDGPTGAVCAFPIDVVIHVLGGSHVILFDGQGVAFSGMSFGAIKLDLTNLDTGATVTVNISGPGGFNENGVNVIGRGPWMTFEPIAQGGMHFTRGVARFIPVSYGVHAILLAGIEEDLCDRVA